MDLEQIRAGLESTDPQVRMRALTALRLYPADVAVPFLISKLSDPEPLIRTFAIIGLGKKRNSEAFAALVEAIHTSLQDPNLLAEAANSLALYGEPALPYLMRLFSNNNHWLIRLSILPALLELDCPAELFELSWLALQDQDETVQESAIEHLAQFSGSPVHEIVLDALIPLLHNASWRIRRQLALALRQFKSDRAINALKQLQQDTDYRVVGAVLEGSLFSLE
jgi:HEAT repeat protein